MQTDENTAFHAMFFRGALERGELKNVNMNDLPRVKSVTAKALLAGEDERHRQTLEALADIDEGRTVAHESVVAWATGLDAEKNKSRTAR